jgi:hypothetical protein
MGDLVEKLLNGLQQQGFSREAADALVHALVDIEESTSRIYGELLPELARVIDQSPDVFKEKLWDVREEFRHIAYHLHDAKLADL